MLTLKAVMKSGKIYFSDGAPPNGEHKILVTFLDEEVGNVLISENQLNWMKTCIIDRRAPLNDRQIKILALTSKGCKSKEIGEELGMTFGAVRTQFYKIYRKLEVKNRAEAISKGIEIGLISHGG
jgi:DNA-binding NarL/FixJ family response regulator